MMEVVPRELTDAEWADVIGLAMKSDLDRELRRKVVEELVDMRQARKLRHGALVAMYSRPPNPV